MKHLLIILLLIGLQARGRVIYVTNKKDKRYIAYRDSVKIYYDHINFKKYALKCFDSVTNWTEWQFTKNRLGFNDKYTETDKKSGQYELLYEYNRWNAIFLIKVQYPKVKVVYKPKIVHDTLIKKWDSTLRIQYVVQKLDGTKRIDSNKKVTFTKSTLKVRKSL